MLLNPVYLFSEDREKLLRLRNVRADFDEYLELYVSHVLGYIGEMKETWMEDVETETARILAINPKKWSEKARKNASLKTMTIMEWWSLYGTIGAPNLTTVAIDVLSQPVTASACERSWSSYGQIHNPTRNRLTMDRQEKLVYIYHNARINDVEIKKRRTATSLLNSQSLTIPPPFDWEEQIDEDEVKENMKTTMGISKIPSQVTHFNDFNDEDFDGPSDGIYDESVDMEDLNETLASCLTGREWKQDSEGNEMKHVLTDSMATKYHIDSEKANELNEKFPHRRVPRVALNCSEIIMEEMKFKMLKDLYGINRGSRPVQERKPVPKEKSRFASSSSQPSLKSCYDMKQRERLKLGINSYIDLNEPRVPMDDEKLNKLQRCYSIVSSDQKRSQESYEMREEPTTSTSGPKSHLNARPAAPIVLHVRGRKGNDVEHRRLVGEFSGEENEIICTQPDSPTQSMSPGGSTRSLHQKKTISYKEQLKGGPDPFHGVDPDAM
ncbi:hypothetical protein R1sor_004843 [Riccia sorocarpa]|uniref:HAT C-terminal dimerisation domain-containing protein n=1 Tax=Riccia sorocarpa TaxID=122646 RepID=A0ABD3HKS9_9MARC